MAIKKDITITVENALSKMSDSFYVYQGDKNIDIYFTIIDNRFEFSTIVPKQYSITIRKPDGNIVPTSNKTTIVDNKVQFTITAELVDELDEIGTYDLLIHLYDDLDSRISIPPVSFEVKQPLVTTNALANSGLVQNAILDEINNKLIRLDDNGKYVKTVWNKGDVITKENLNKIENQLEDLDKDRVDISSQLADKTNSNSNQKRPLVVFISDDGSGKEYDIVAPIFEAKGCVYTVATRGDVIDSEGGITTQQLRNLISRGHSVCSHTWTHKDLTTLNETDIRQQYSKSIQLIETATQVKCRHLAYPFGAWNDLALNIAREYFDSALATNMENYYVSDAVLDQYAIPRLSIIYNNGNTQEQWSIITNYIDECYRKNGLLIFCTHAFEYDGKQSNIDYLNQTIDYIKGKNIAIVNLDTAINERRNIIDEGNFKGSFVKISKTGGIKSNNLDLYAIKKSNFTVDINTDISKFEKNKITVTEILNDANFPENGSGQLLTYNVTNNYDLSFQLYYPALSNRFYKRNYIRATNLWNSFVKIDSEKTAPIFKSTSDIDVSNPPSSFTDGQITVGKAVNFPEASGTVTTYKINIANTAIYQIFQPANSRNIYKRKNIDSATWDEWQCYSPCRRIGKFINAPTAFTGFYKTTQTVAEAKVGMTVTVSPNNGTCGDGVIWCAYVPADGQVEIRWYNFGGSSVAMNTSWQISLIG